MKRTHIWCLIPLLTAFTIAIGQNTGDVVILKDGTRLVGAIETITPNESVTIRTADGTKHVLSWTRIDRIEKAERPPATIQKRYHPGLESYYAYLAFGYASTTYPTAAERYIDQEIRPFSPTHVGVALDMLGFYWPLADDQTLVGFVIAMAGDRYSYEDGSRSVQYTTSIVGASAMHFFGEIPGDGPFLRGELGLASISSQLVDGHGMGAQLSGGYGIAISDETRLLLQTGYAYRHLDTGNCSTWSLTIGFLL